MAAGSRKSVMIFNTILTPSLRRSSSAFCRSSISPGIATRLTLKPLESTCFQPSIYVRTLSNKKEDAKFVKDLKSSPQSAMWLGLSGAIPFTGLAGLSIAAPEYLDILVQAQCGYGACILSFLGAIHWGYALSNDKKLEPNWGTLVYSVTPSLVAWSALLVKPQYGLITISLGLLYALSKDLGTSCFPGWYHALRKVLTTAAVSSLAITALAAFINLH